MKLHISGHESGFLWVAEGDGWYNPQMLGVWETLGAYLDQWQMGKSWAYKPPLLFILVDSDVLCLLHTLPNESSLSMNLSLTGSLCRQTYEKTNKTFSTFPFLFFTLEQTFPKCMLNSIFVPLLSWTQSKHGFIPTTQRYHPWQKSSIEGNTNDTGKRGHCWYS